LAVAALVALPGSAAWAQGVDSTFPPHKVIGNIYYVGSPETATYLITTDAGHILINAGFATTVPKIESAVEQLGFHLKDVKILLMSHAHDDHVAGNAPMKRKTGAQVMVMDADADIVRTGGRGDFAYDSLSSYEPVAVDRVLHDGDKVTLGGTTLVARKTPGHTKGATTWTLMVPDGGKTYNVVIIGGTTVNPGYKLVGNTKYPEIATDFAQGFQTLKSLPVDVYLGAHGVYYRLAAKYKQLRDGATSNPFIDPDGYRAFVANREKAYLDELAKQKAARPMP
jgi:metallo-beta-lactamase class B